MINISVVDISAESRSRLVAEINSFLRHEGADTNVIPCVGVKPYSLQEFKFHSAPDLCVIGPEIVGSDILQIVQIRKTFPNSSILVRLLERAGLDLIDHIIRLGADDVLSGSLSPVDFLQRIVVMARRAVKTSGGKLVVVAGGKGGVGVTSVAAAVGEGLFRSGKQVALVDLDFETQDLSRFLQVRPFINENLRSLLDGQTPVTAESVAECLVPLWEGEDGYMVMPPVCDTDDLYVPSSNQTRVLLSILEALDSQFDTVVVDLGGARGEIGRLFLRTADKLVFVVNSDPASMYASAEKLLQARSVLSADCQIAIINNGWHGSGVSEKVLRGEFLRAVKLEDHPSKWFQLPFCKQGVRWPGSGGTLFSQSNKPIRRVFEQLLEGIEVVESLPEKSGVFGIFKVKVALKEESPATREISRNRDVALIADTKRLSLPEPIERAPRKQSEENWLWEGDFYSDDLVSSPRIGEG